MQLSTSARNAAVNAVVDLIDAGAGAGVLIFQTSGSATLATLTMSDPAFGDATNGTATANAITSANPSSNGTIALFSVQDSDSNEVFSGTVNTSGADINLNGLAVTTADTIQISALSVSQPAS